MNYIRLCVTDVCALARERTSWQGLRFVTARYIHLVEAEIKINSHPCPRGFVFNPPSPPHIIRRLSRESASQSFAVTERSNYQSDDNLFFTMPPPDAATTKKRRTHNQDGLQMTIARLMNDVVVDFLLHLQRFSNVSQKTFFISRNRMQLLLRRAAAR